MKAAAPPVFVLHNWLPGFNSLAGSLVALAGTLGVLLQLVLDFFTWLTVAEILLGLTVLALWLGYGRVIVTPEVLTVVGCGLWRRPRYASPLAEVRLDGQWALGASATVSTLPTLDFYTEWDWYTPTDYLIINYRGAQIMQFFSLKQYAKIKEAVATMAACNRASSTALLPFTPDA